MNELSLQKYYIKHHHRLMNASPVGELNNAESSVYFWVVLGDAFNYSGSKNANAFDGFCVYSMRIEIQS